MILASPIRRDVNGFDVVHERGNVLDERHTLPALGLGFTLVSRADERPQLLQSRSQGLIGSILREYGAGPRRSVLERGDGRSNPQS